MTVTTNMVMPKIERDAVARNYGKFYISPLERGYGITIGNALRRILLAPERLIPVGAGTERIGALYMRSQVIIDALAAVPATLGFVLFLIYGNMGMLVLFSLGSIVLLVAVFPRYEILETAVMARIMAGEAIGTPAKESLQDG